MVRKFFVILFCILILMPFSVLASSVKPALVIVPFLSSVTIARNTSADVTLVVQNNTGVNQTITNLDPTIPPGSLVTVNLLETSCGFLSPGASCDVTYKITSSNTLGNAELNIRICTYNGTMCSRIKEPITIKRAPLVAVQVTPTNPTAPETAYQQFKATGLYGDNTTQDITDAVTWSSSNPAIATISNATGSKGLALGVAPGVSAIAATLDGIIGSTTLTVTDAVLTSIVVVPTNRTVPVGVSRQYFAVGVYSDGTFRNLTDSVVWGSSNVTIATVSNLKGSKGIVLARNAGSTTISATFESVSGNTNLNVTPAVLTSISVTPADTSLAKGYTQQFTATGIYSDDSTHDITDKVTWSTGSALVAIVSNRASEKGLGLAVGVGTTAVSATLDGVSGSTNFQVTPPVLVSIDVSPRDSSLAAGQTLQYTALGTYSDKSVVDLTDAVTWASSNVTAATISNAADSKGFATSVGVGTTTISAIQNGIQGSTPLTVTPAALVSIAVTPTNPRVANGLQQQFTATGTYSNNTTKDITTVVLWTSSSSAVAVISNAPGSQGLATSVAVGSTSIRARMSGVTGTTTMTVSAATLVSIAVTPADISIAKATTQQFTATGTYTDASTLNITNQVTWQSSNTAVAVISNATDSKGLATGIEVGSTTIRALSDAIVGSTTLSVINLSIGQSYGGGKVACLDGGLNNLIATNANNSAGIIWGGSGTITYAQSDTDGLTNTAKIVNELGAGTTYAAGLCNAYEIDSAGNTPCVLGNVCYRNWFLPSTNQLICLRKNRNQVGGFTKSIYWTSTEYSASPSLNAWALTFANSGQGPAVSAKTSTNAVRCVRLIQ